jgi:enamine deaminase RidA (YjgF/YER057c/UK114 family)
MTERQFISNASPWEDLDGHSRAVIDGDWIFVSGVVGQDLVSLTMPESARVQAELALDSVEAALALAAAGVMDVVRVRVYVPDRGDVADVGEVVARRLGSARPALTTLCCALAVDGAKVGIEVTAKRRKPTA